MENKQIASALVKAKKAFNPALKDKTNPAYRSKYADLGACIEAVEVGLLDNGIFMYQRTFEDATGVTVETVFIHESGEQLECGKLHVPAAKQDPQGYGSALTYARRYSLMAACGIAPEDDDGNAASKPQSAAKPAAKFNLAASLKWIKEAATPQEGITRARNAYGKADTDEARALIQSAGNSYKKLIDDMQQETQGGVA